MYIVAIAWLYVIMMMSITARSITAGVLTFVFYGLAPLLLVLWLFGGGSRKRASLRAAAAARSAAASQSVGNAIDRPDGSDAQANQGDLLK